MLGRFNYLIVVCYQNCSSVWEKYLRSLWKKILGFRNMQEKLKIAFARQVSYIFGSFLDGIGDFYGSTTLIFVFFWCGFINTYLFCWTKAGISSWSQVLDSSWSQVVDLVTPASKKSNKEPSSLDKLLAKKRAERSAAQEIAKKIANTIKVRFCQRASKLF